MVKLSENGRLNPFIIEGFHRNKKGPKQALISFLCVTTDLNSPYELSIRFETEVVIGMDKKSTNLIFEISIVCVNSSSPSSFSSNSWNRFNDPLKTKDFTVTNL